METTTRYIRVERSEIGYIKFIFEAYEGIAVISTVDSDRTVIAVRMAPGCEEEVELILADLGKNIRIEEIRLEQQPDFRG